jgi:hypothetical protein
MREYALALVDWLACAARGSEEPAARAALGLDEPVVHAGAAGHVLDFDDTYLPGIAHPRAELGSRSPTRRAGSRRPRAAAMRRQMPSPPCTRTGSRLAMLPPDARGDRGRQRRARLARSDGRRAPRLAAGRRLRSAPAGRSPGEVLDPLPHRLHPPVRAAARGELRHDRSRPVVLAQRIEVRADGSLLESECVLVSDGREVARVEAALGSPQRPMDARALREKVAGLAGERLVEALEDLERPAEELLELAGLGRPTAGCRSPATSTCARRSPTSPPNEPAIVTTLRARSSSSAAARRACSTYCGPP